MTARPTVVGKVFIVLESRGIWKQGQKVVDEHSQHSGLGHERRERWGEEERKTKERELVHGQNSRVT